MNRPPLLTLHWQPTRLHVDTHQGAGERSQPVATLRLRWHGTRYVLCMPTHSLFLTDGDVHHLPGATLTVMINASKTDEMLLSSPQRVAHASAVCNPLPAMARTIEKPHVDAFNTGASQQTPALAPRGFDSPVPSSILDEGNASPITTLNPLAIFQQLPVSSASWPASHTRLHTTVDSSHQDQGADRGSRHARQAIDADAAHTTDGNKRYREQTRLRRGINIIRRWL